MSLKSLCLLLLTVTFSATAHAETVGDGVSAIRAKNYQRAFVIFSTLADRGDADAMADLGAMYMAGLGVTRDLDHAIKLLTPAANAGSAIAETDLGNAYAHGVGVPVDYSKAYPLFLMAARKGHSEAQRGLGALYFEGHGVKKDFKRAYIWESLASVTDSRAGQSRDDIKSKLSPAELADANQQLGRCRALGLRYCE